MRNYFYLQVKRTAKLFPWVMGIALILFLGLSALFLGLIRYLNETEENQKFKIGIVGEANDRYLQLGLSALQAFDDTRFSMELETMDEAQAFKALERGELSAYLVFPEDFSRSAMLGKVKTIRLITGSGSSDLILLFKKEIADAVTRFVSESQKGVYGVQNALDSNGYQNLSSKYLNQMNMEYLDLLLHRNDLYQIEELGIHSGLNPISYLFCGFLVFLLMLTGLPYAVIQIRKDWSLNRVLAANQVSAAKQILSEYASYTGALLTAAAGVLAILAVALSSEKIPLPDQTDAFGTLMPLAGRIAGVILLTAAMDIMFFELSGNMINGILLHFFCTVSLCYITGCFYPIYAFPKSVQQISPFLPSGCARDFLASGLSGEAVAPELVKLIGFTVVFLIITIAARRKKCS